MIFSTACFTKLANSSGWPGLAGNSIAFRNPSFTLSDNIAVMAESNMLGAIVTTRIPNLDKSLAIGSVMDATAPLLAAYATCPICPSNAAALATITTTPLSPSFPSGGAWAKRGRNCRTRSSVPRRLMFSTKSMLSNETGLSFLSRMRPGKPTPAQGMMPPRGCPVSAIQDLTFSTAAVMSLVEVTSTGMKIVRGRDWAREGPWEEGRSRRATEAPAERRDWIVARPRPEALRRLAHY